MRRTGFGERGGSTAGGRIVSEATRIFKGRPGGAKGVKEDQRQGKIREGILLANVEATKSMAGAHMRKVALLEDQNLMMLMLMSDADSNAIAKEYLRLRRQMKLRKLRKLMADEEDHDRDQLAEAAVVARAGEWEPGAGREGLPNQPDGVAKDQQADEHHQPDDQHQPHEHQAQGEHEHHQQDVEHH